MPHDAEDEDEEEEAEAAEEGISTSSDTSTSCMYETAVEALDSEMVKGEEDRYWYWSAELWRLVECGVDRGRDAEGDLLEDARDACFSVSDARKSKM